MGCFDLTKGLVEVVNNTAKSSDLMKKYREENKEDEIKTIYEAFFVFAGMWAYGASLDEDKLSFSGIWKGMSKIKFPDVGQCFDYFYDPLTAAWIHWDEKTA
jgi:hypothetical protein